MPQAVKLSQAVVNLVAHKIDEPVADVQAMHEHFKATHDHAVYVVFDYTSPNTHIYYPWNVMGEDQFRETFRFLNAEKTNQFRVVDYL